MKQVLIVAYYFPPVAASGAMRPLGFCRNLPAWGWQPRVLTTTPDSVYPIHPVDVKLGERVPAAIEVLRVPYRDRLQLLLKYRERFRRLLKNSSLHRSDGSPSKTAVERAAVEARTTYSNVKDVLFDWAFNFPDLQWSWYGPAVRHFHHIDEKHIPDVIFATGGPWTNFIIGAALAKRFDRPLVLDYRDPWNCNAYYSFSSKRLAKKSQRMEAQVCRASSHVVVNTEELRDRLIEEYEELRGRCSWIPNGFERDVLMEGDRLNEDSNVVASSHGYELCHFGTVYGKRTPRVLLQALWEMFRDGDLKPENIRIRFVGGWDTTDQDCERYAINLEQQGFLRRQPAISHSQCLREMKRSSVLLVLQPDSPLQVPGKIYEYIATGRPLLLIGGEGATANLVTRHALGISSPNELKNLKILLNDLATGTKKLAPPDTARVNRFDYRSLAGELAAVLDAVVRRSHHP